MSKDKAIKEIIFSILKYLTIRRIKCTAIFYKDIVMLVLRGNLYSRVWAFSKIELLNIKESSLICNTIIREWRDMRETKIDCLKWKSKLKKYV